MYRIYLRTKDHQVSEKTNTVNRAAAELAFKELVNRSELDGEKLAAVLSYNSSHLAFHRFDRGTGQPDFWRDKLDTISWPDTLPSSINSSDAIIDKPTPAQVREMRMAANLTQSECAKRFGYSLTGWQKKEDAGDSGRSLSRGEFELLLLIAGKHPNFNLKIKDMLSA